MLEADSSNQVSKPAECNICKEKFASKRQMFKHLEDVHGYVDDNAKPVKVACLVGWLSEETSDIETYIKDAKSSADSSADANFESALGQEDMSGNGTTKERVETTLFDAIYKCFDANLPPTKEERMKQVARAAAAASHGEPEISGGTPSSRPKSVTRGSQTDSTSAVGLERTCHAVADTFCFHLHRPIGNEQVWLDKLNAQLPSSIRVLSCRALPGKGSDMNAYANCSQRRFELMLPLHLILPENDDEYVDVAGHYIEGKTFKTLNPQNWAKVVKKKPTIDDEFPINTPEGERRVRFFRIVKTIMKNLGGRYQMFHNFTSGGACPDDPYALKSVDRMYHKAMLSSATGESWAIFSISGDNFLRGQIRRLFGVALAIARGWLPDEFLDIAIRFSNVYRDNLMKKQRELSKANAVAKAEARAAEELAQVHRKRHERAARGGASQSQVSAADDMVDGEEDASQLKRVNLKEKPRKAKAQEFDSSSNMSAAKSDVLNENSAEEGNPQDWRNSKSHVCSHQFSCEVLCEIPSVPSLGMYLAECKYSNYEAKYEKQGFVLDPRRVRDIHRTEADTVSEKRINDWEQTVQQHIMSSPAMYAVCKDWSARTKAQCEIIWARAQHLMALTLRTDAELLSSCTRLYPDLGPLGSISRAPPAYRHVLQLLRDADRSGAWPASSLARQRVMQEEKLVEQGGQGGTFSVGAFPEGLLQPKGNALFPELMRAAFELERVIFPHRTPSSTIAINKHAQFKPHRDSGAGSGQSRSAIVALGDFVGGELGVEFEVHDIRYQPLEFDGWGQRHYTLPFQGERYSLVWFTPKGCGPNDYAEDNGGNESKKQRQGDYY
jgi:tRNA U38,U39,U40 pseudouridine synthase TruA